MFSLTQIDLDTLQIMGLLAIALIIRFGPMSDWFARMFIQSVFRMLGYARDHAPEENKADSRANRRLWTKERKLRWKWFNILVWALLGTAFACLLLPPSSFLHLQAERFGATLGIGLTALVAIFFFGANIYGGRRGWLRWSFWLSLLVAVGSIVLVSQWYHPRRRGGMELLVILGLLTFFVFFSILRNIDNAGPEPKPSRIADHTSLSRPPSHGV